MNHALALVAFLVFIVGASALAIGARDLREVVGAFRSDASSFVASGVAERGAAEFLRGPLSGEPVVWYRVVLRAKPESTDAMFERVESVPFVLQTEREPVTIDPATARRQTNEASSALRDLAAPDRARLTEWLAASGKADVDDSVIVVEESVPAAHRIFVAGRMATTSRGGAYRGDDSTNTRDVFIGIGARSGALTAGAIKLAVGAGLIVAAVLLFLPLVRELLAR